MDRPGAQDHLEGRTDGTQLAVPQELEAGAARAGERQLDRRRLGQNRQVPVPHHRPEVGVRRATASAPLDVQVHRADALGLGDVQVVEVRHAGGPAGVNERGRHGVEVPGALDADRATGAAERAGAVLPVLRLLEQGQHGDEVPERVAGLRPAVVVGPVPAGPHHGIDAARPAEHLAQRQGDGAASDVGARLVTVGPVVGRADVLHPLRRVPEAGAFSRSARLEQENGGVGAVHQAARDHATRRPGADDHIVVTVGERRAAPGLMMMLHHSRSLPGECLFRHVDDGRMGELLESLPAHQLGSDAGLLRAGVRRVRSEIEMLVHPDRAGIDPGRHLERAVAVRGPDEPQAKVRVVGTGAVVDRIVDVEPLDGDTRLAGVKHGSGIELWCHVVRVDVPEDDRRVIAAEFQGQALQRPGGARHHLLAGRGGAGERDLGHVGVAGEGGSQVVLIDDDVDDACRQDPGAEFAQPERRQRRGRGRLGHDRDPGEQGRRDLEDQEDHREVPRRDGRDDAEGLVPADHLLRGILLEHLGRQVQRGEVADRADRPVDLPQRLRQRLALPWVRRRANALCSASSASANLTSSAARCRSGVADQVGNAPFAAATACFSWVRSGRGAAVRVRPVAGLITSRVLAPSTSLPSINNLNSVITCSSDSPAVSGRLGRTGGLRRPGEDHVRPVTVDLLVRLARQQRRDDAAPAADRHRPVDECHGRDLPLSYR